MRRPLAALLAVLAVVAAGAASCDRRPAGVQVGEARLATVVEVVDAAASVTAKSVSTLTAAAPGTLAQVLVKTGDRVRRDQVLAVVDSPSAQRRLADARSALAALDSGGGAPDVDSAADIAELSRQTDAAAAQAFAAARQAAGLIPEPQLRATVLAQLAAAEAAYREATARLASLLDQVSRGLASIAAAADALVAAQRVPAAAAYDLAQTTVAALTVRAPTDGVVQLGGPSSGGGSLPDLLDQLPPGSVPDPGALGGGTPGAPPAGADTEPAVGSQVKLGTPLVTIVDTTEPGLVAEVAETDVLLVRAGGTGVVELDAVPGAEYPVTVRSVDVLPTSTSRGGVSYRVRLGLGAGRTADGQPAPVPLPGMSAVAHLEVRKAADAVAVPAQAVFSEAGRDAVWLVRDGKAARQYVKVGVQGEELVQILDGLTAGQRLVVRGVEKVKAGTRL